MEGKPSSPFYYGHDGNDDLILIKEGKVIARVIFQNNVRGNAINLSKLVHPIL
jgi:hypothetical protein